MLPAMKQIFLLFLIVLPPFSVTASPAAHSRPNILFIYTDDHSHRTVSAYPESYPFVKTPAIDSLAANGVRFRYAYIGTWCMPSRAGMLTGHYQHAVQSMRMVGKYPGSDYDPEKCPFWPKVFRENGYQTAHIGKWHTGTDTGYGRDWDYQIVWNRPRHPDNAGNYYKDQLIEFNGAEATLVKGYSTDNYTNWAVDYLKGKGRDPEKPWYLWLCYGAVHAPYTPAKRHLNSYPKVKVAVPADIYPPREGKPAHMQGPLKWVRGEDGQPHLRGGKRATGQVGDGMAIHGSSLNDWVRQYHQGVLAIDEGVSRLIAALKSSGQYDNTLIVFTSDQGFAWGQHGLRSKVAPYDASIRSPLIISMPSRFPSGKECPIAVAGPDLVPTFFEIAGISLPWKMHGHSLIPYLKDPSRKQEHPALVTFTAKSYGSDTNQIPTDPAVLKTVAGIPWYAMIQDGRFKYVRYFVKNEIEELYDLESDPEELVNLALSKDRGERLKKMRARTIAELRRTDAVFVDHLPPVRKLDH